MSLGDWAAIAEIVGALAVVASLVYVGSQIRQSNAVMRAEAHRDIELKIADLAAQMAANKRFTESLALIRDDRPRDSFAPADRSNIALILIGFIRVYQACFHQHREGVVTDKILEIADSQLFRTRFVRDSWPRWKDEFDPEFAAFFESTELETPPDRPI